MIFNPRANSTLLVVWAFIFLLGQGCGQIDPQSPWQKPEVRKSEGRKSICDSLSLPRSFALNGTNILQLVQCVNDDMKTGSNLNNLEKLLIDIGQDNLDRGIDFLFLRSDKPKGNFKFPYLAMTMAFLERGSFDKNGDPVSAIIDHWQSFNQFLKTLDLNPFVSILKGFSVQEQLNEAFDRLARLVDSLPAKLLSSTLRAIVENHNFQESTLIISKALSSNEDLWSLIKSFFEFSAGQVLDEGSYSICLDRLLDVNPLDATNFKDCLKNNYRVDSGSALTRPGDVWKELLAEINPQPLVGFVGEILSDFSSKSVDGIEKALWQMKHLAKIFGRSDQESVSRMLANLEALVDPSANLEMFSQVLDTVNVAFSDPKVADILYDLLHKKAAHSALLKDLKDFILKGGVVPGCQEAFPGLASLNPSHESFGEASAYQLITDFVSPSNYRCGDGRSPLVQWLKSRCGYNQECHDSFEISTFSDNRAGSETDLTLVSDSNNQLISKLVYSAIDHYAKRLKQDPYLFWNLHLARGPIDGLEFESYLLNTLGSSPLNLQKLAEVDLEISKNGPYKGVFLADPLETILGLYVEKLAASAQEFQEIFADNPNSGPKLQNILNGTYAGGPLEQWVNLAIDEQIATRLDKLPFQHERTPQTVSSFKFGLSKPGAVFSDYSTIDSALRTPDLIGNGKFYSILTPNKQIIPRPNNSHGTHNGSFWLFTEHPSGSLVNWRRFFDHNLQGSNNNFLLAKDAPFTSPVDFSDWITDLGQHLRDPDQWSQNLYLAESFGEGLPTDFYSTVPYSQREIHQLISFYFKYYLFNPILELPDDLSIAPAPDKNHAMLGYPYFTGDFDQLWQVFQQNYWGYDPTRKIEDQNAWIRSELNVLLPNLTQNYRPLKLPRASEDKLGLLDSHPLMTLYAYHNFISLKIKGKRKYLTPIAGSDTQCAETRSNCVFASSDENIISYFANLSEVLYCPLSPRGSNREFSERFKSFINPILALPTSVRSGNLCEQWKDFLPTILKSTSRPAYGFPPRLAEHVLRDLLTLGKDPVLKDGVRDIPLALRSIKAAMNRGQSKYQFYNHILTTGAGGVNALTNQVAQSENHLFWLSQPTYFDSLLHGILEQLPETSREVILSRSGPSKLAVQTLVTDLLDILNRQIKVRNRILTSALELINWLASHEQHASTLAYVIVDPQSIAMAKLLDQATPQMFSSQTKFDWNWPGYNLLRSATSHETLGIFHRALEVYSPEDIRVLLESSSKYLSHIGSVDSQEIYFKAVFKAVKKVLLRQVSEESTVLEHWDATATGLSNLRCTGISENHVAYLVSWLFESKPTLLEEKSPAISGSIPQLASYLVRYLIPDLDDWSKSIAEDGSEQIRRLVSTASLPIEQLSEDPQLQIALLTFLRDSRLGIEDPVLLSNALRPGVERELLIPFLSHLLHGKVSYTNWQEALEESGSLLQQTHHFLDLMDKKMIWNDDVAFDYSRSISSLKRLSSESSSIMFDQIEVIKQWFRKD